MEEEAPPAGAPGGPRRGGAAEVEELKALFTKREKEAAAKQQEQEALLKGLQQQVQQLQQQLLEEQKGRQQAEAKYKLVLEDSSVKAILKKHSTVDGFHRLTEIAAAPAVCDRRFIDIMLLGPAHVGKRELLKALVERLGDTNALLQLRGTAEDDSIFEQLVKVTNTCCNCCCG